MTGRLPIHVTENNDYACGEDGPAPLNMTFMPKMLKKAGYKTHHVGKWHIGGSATHRATPFGRGFDTSFGYIGGEEDHYLNTNPGCGGCGQHVDLWRNDKPAYGENNTKYSAQLYADEAVSIIKAHDVTTPLFMYLAAQSAHAPNEPDKYANLYSADYTKEYVDYNGMISAVDDIAKNVTAALRETGMWDNTLILFSSDNGGPAAKSVSGSAANNYPLRGGKHTAWEGGHRVIAFLTGGFIPSSLSGTKLDGYVHIADWYTTFAGLAGVDPADHGAIEAGFPGVDGIDMWPYITGAVDESPRFEIPLASKYSAPAKGAPDKNGSAALIVGDYKLVRYTQQYCFWMGEVYPNATTTHKNEDICDCGASGCLFNIKTDPNEHTDLSASMPEKAADMLQRAKEWDATSIEATRQPGWRGSVNTTKACEKMEQNGGFWGPYESY